MLPFDCGGERLALLPQRAVYVPAHRSLLVADAHLGKAVSFRRLGVPVPEATTGGTLARLDAALTATGAERVIFLGDLLHAREARQPALMETLAGLHAPGVEWVLVRGNHDLHAGVPPELGLTVVDEPLLMAPFALCHHPDARPGHYVLAGHIHPALRVEAGGDRLRLPCFAFGTEVGLLPAFGSFTGHMTLEPDAGMRCFVAAADRVLEVPHASARRRGKA